MPDPATYRPAPGSIPVEPGVYRFRDPYGRVIYVGKAKSLRSRLTSYFADVSSLAPRTRQMVMTAGSVEWTVVNTEVEALQLEYNWIKEFDPRFNIRYRDDKSYPVLAVTLNEEYPRLMVYRGARRKGVRYFGPYRMPGPSGKPLICSRGCFPPVRVPQESSSATGRSVGRVCWATSTSARHLASGGSAQTSTGRSSRTSATSSPARPTGWSVIWNNR